MRTTLGHQLVHNTVQRAEDWSTSSLAENPARLQGVDLAKFRVLLATVGLHLSRHAYVEHADCAERKFHNDIESVIEEVEEARSYAAWHMMLQSWESNRDIDALKIACKQMKDLL